MVGPIVAAVTTSFRDEGRRVVGMGPEWIVVGAVALLLFGGSQLPKLARSLGQAQNEFKKGMSEGAVEDDSTPSAGEDTSS